MHLEEARYMSQQCELVRDWPNYEGREVQRCSYPYSSNGKTLSAIVYLLNPSGRNIADRIENACVAIGLAQRAGCGRTLASWIIQANGGQFPVAGFVIENKEDAGGVGFDPVYLEFRDGVTIKSVDDLNFTDQQLNVEAMEHAAKAPVTQTRNYARIANATRDDYYLSGGAQSVGHEWQSDPGNRWLSVVRENELRAQDTGVDDLLRGVARRMRDELDRD